MAEPALKATALSQHPSANVEQEMPPQDAEVYAALRQLNCSQGHCLACPATVIIGRRAVVVDCPTCVSIAKRYPDLQSD